MGTITFYVKENGMAAASRLQKTQRLLCKPTVPLHHERAAEQRDNLHGRDIPFGGVIFLFRET